MELIICIIVIYKLTSYLLILILTLIKSGEMFIIFIFRMKKLRSREVKKLAQDHAQLVEDGSRSHGVQFLVQSVSIIPCLSHIL